MEGRVKEEFSEETMFTRLVKTKGVRGAEVQRRPGRPALVVSSTSWTADEDFFMLLDAVVMYEVKGLSVVRVRCLLFQMAAFRLFLFFFIRAFICRKLLRTMTPCPKFCS